MALLLAAAATFRLLVGIDSAHLKPWLGGAALCFLLATAGWAWLVVPAVRAAGEGAEA